MLHRFGVAAEAAQGGLGMMREGRILARVFHGGARRLSIRRKGAVEGNQARGLPPPQQRLCAQKAGGAPRFMLRAHGDPDASQAANPCMNRPTLS